MGEQGVTVSCAQERCCPSPEQPCAVQNLCCIRLCSARSAGLRAGLDEPESVGCCPTADPCGELLSSGSCVQCACLPQLQLATRLGLMEPGQDQQGGLRRSSGNKFDNYTAGEVELLSDILDYQPWPSNETALDFSNESLDSLRGAFDAPDSAESEEESVSGKPTGLEQLVSGGTEAGADSPAGALLPLPRAAVRGAEPLLYPTMQR